MRYCTEWDGLGAETRGLLEIIAEFLREYRGVVMYETDRKRIYNISRDFITGRGNHAGLHQRLWNKFDECSEFEALTGVVLKSDWKELGVHEELEQPWEAVVPSFEPAPGISGRTGRE